MKAIKPQAQLKVCLSQMLEAAKRGKTDCKLSTYRDVLELLMDGGLEISPKISIEAFPMKESHEIFISWNSGTGKLGGRLMRIVKHYQCSQNSKVRVVNRRGARREKKSATGLKWVNTDVVPCDEDGEQRWETEERLERERKARIEAEELLAEAEFVCDFKRDCNYCPISDKCTECVDALSVYGDGFFDNKSLMSICCSEKKV